MKIVYMTYGIHYPGGMERVLAVKANYLADVLGHEVYIVITDGKGRSPFFKFSDKIKIIDLEINYRDLSGTNFVLKALPYLNKIRLHKKRLSQFLLKTKPDLCVSMFSYEANILHKMRDDSKKIIESHFCRVVDILRNKEKKGVSKFIGNILYKRNSKIANKYDCLVTLTKDDLSLYDDVLHKICIPNPLTTHNTLVNDNIVGSDKKIVLAVGRVSYQKGFDNLIEIWNKIEKKNPDWELRIYGSQGDTSYFNKISNLIKKYELSRVKCYPPVQDIESVYQKSDILVVTSNYEGFNLSIVEGMSFGLPVVSFNCPCGPGEIIQHNVNGLLISPGNISEFARSLDEIMNNGSLRARLGKNAIIRSDDYSISKIMSLWTALFEKILKSNQSN